MILRMKITRLGVRIKQLREAKDWSQNELSRRAKVDQGLISRLEDGVGNPGLNTLGAIAKALRVTISELTRGV
jgi:transcriptional regulator with XRE-family HTH domain